MPRPPEDRDLRLFTEDGVELGAKWVCPEPILGTLVACHPHPLFGGTMTNKVVHSLYKVFRDRGFAAIRFDFRGAGTSLGSHGGGITELLDVAAAAEALEEQLEDLPRTSRNPSTAAPQVLGGFSFGSQVGLRFAAETPSLSHRVGIGLPLGKEGYDFDFLGNGDRRPLHLVVGEDDEFCPRFPLEQLVCRLREDLVPVQATVIPAANHFFDRQGHVLRQELDRIAASILGQVVPNRRYPVVSL